MLGAVLSLILLSGCQKKEAEPAPHASAVAQTASIIVQSKTVTFPLPQAIYCESDECTAYQVKTVQTNLDWLNDYFIQRLKKDAPLAFTKSPYPAKKDIDERDLNQSHYSVSLLNQHKNLVTFVLESDSYAAGAAHGMYHKEYLVFDIDTKQRIALSDLYSESQKTQVYQALYKANQPWLQEHGIAEGKLEPTDNFYYGKDGLVFVYPLYELASYADGMTELTLPYSQTTGLINTHYLP